LFGCQDRSALEPPEGWVGDGTRWWREGADTANVFRDLETLQSMAVVNPYEESRIEATRAGIQRGVAEIQVREAVKRSLIRLYRNEPHVVDSLFERFVTPKIQNDMPSGDLGAYIEQYKREGYDLIRNHFREPLVRQEATFPYPDSLRRRNLTGSVLAQVRLDESGEPVAVELIEGVHPALDFIAMRATTQMKWQPAYRRKPGRWQAIPSWARVSFSVSPR
jgi:hypothetical protein